MIDIKIKKKISQVVKASRDESKLETCFICGLPKTSFCNSHSVPQMILRNISIDGLILQSNSLCGVEVIDVEKGIKNSGTFHLICGNCDSSLFVDYENEINLSTAITNKMLAEIAVKNYLLQISKRYLEIHLFKNAQQQMNNLVGKEILDEIHELDLKDYIFHYKRAKKIVDKNLKSGYKVILYEKLPYIVPIAAQSVVCLYNDLYGNVVNDIYDTSPTVRMQDLHLCIFPLKTESIIVLFYHKDDSKYFDFERKFLRKTISEQIKIINFLLFRETENYYLSKQLSNEVLENKSLKKLSREHRNEPDFGFVETSEFFNKKYTPVCIDDIPNLLSEKYKI